MSSPQSKLWRNWPCWVAVVFGAGIAIYFALPLEPTLAVAPATLALAAGLAIIARQSGKLLVPALLALALAGGFGVAQLRAWHVEAPVLGADLERAVISGEITDIELLPTGHRVTLGTVSIAGLPSAATPARIRLKVAVGQPELRAGQRVTGLVDLSPPQGPAAPGSYDFRRDAYFQRLGAIGFAYGRLRVAPVAPEDEGSQWTNAASRWISDLRRGIALKIMSQLPERSGALAVALIVGDQRAIAKADVEAMRDSGLAHILSISGLHIGLAAGLVFFSLRALLASIPMIALELPIKKWAAIAAILAAFTYAMLAGWTTPTQRAFVMGGLVFAAILADRSPISLRLVGVAALAVLAMRPEALVGASFQMSFAAVFLLIVAFEKLAPWMAAVRERIGTGAGPFFVPGWLGHAGLWLLASILSSLVATFATMPFVIVHFDRVAVYGTVANALAVPLTGFWIMPCAVLVLLAMPFGLEALPLAAMGKGCEILLWIAQSVSAWPSASLLVPAPPQWAQPASALGIIAIGLGDRWWRLCGVIPILAGCLAGYLSGTPTILVGPQGDLVAFRAPDGSLVMSRSRGAEIIRETWLRREARVEAGDIDSMDDMSGWLECSVDHCRWRAGVELSVVLDGDVRSRTVCQNAHTVIIPKGRDRAGCSELTRVIDRGAIATMGAINIYVKGDRVSMRSSLDATGQRPWTRAPDVAAEAANQ